MTAVQKLALCERHRDHPALSLCALCAWAGATFKLPRNPSPATLLVLFKQPLTEDAVRANPSRKTSQHVSYLSLEQALVRWLKRCELLQIPVVTWATIRAKAEKTCNALMRGTAYVPNTKLESMMFLDGWIQKLQKRHGLKPQRVYGEAASARAANIDEERAALRIITSKYSSRDIFCKDA